MAVAPDALGLAIVARWEAQMPFLVSLLARHQVTLRSAMPTITPVNFATMVTGAPPEVHGIAAFTDDFACETLFDVVRAHGGKSAGVGQKGYTGSELLGRSADLWGRAASNTDDEVGALALGFAGAERPAFLIVRLGSTDDVFHRYGPSSPQVVPQLRETDEGRARMADRLTALGYASSSPPTISSTTPRPGAATAPRTTRTRWCPARGSRELPCRDRPQCVRL